MKSKAEIREKIEQLEVKMKTLTEESHRLASAEPFEVFKFLRHGDKMLPVEYTLRALKEVLEDDGFARPFTNLEDKK